MPRRGSRKRIGEGIFRDTYGLAAVVKVGTEQREKRFPFGTDLKELRQWREAERVRLRGHQAPIVRGTLTSHLARYLKVVEGSLDRATFKSRRSEVRAWTAAIGDKTPRQVNGQAIRETIGVWRAAGRSPKTIRNRVGTLAHAWTTLYGQPLPMDGVELPTITKRRPAFVTAAIIKQVEAQLRAHEASGQLPNAKTRARFMVIATCGMRPAQLKKMTPADLDLKRRVVLIPAAKGGEPVGLWLNDDMRAAWTVFARAQAWGRFDTRSFGRRLRSAGWPAGVRPYNLRHAVGIELGERGVDMRTIADMLGHSDDSTTRAFYVPVLASKLRKASQSLSGRFGWLAPSAGTAKRTKQSRSKSRTAAGS